jgi:hypothetical protein
VNNLSIQHLHIRQQQRAIRLDLQIASSKPLQEFQRLYITFTVFRLYFTHIISPFSLLFANKPPFSLESHNRNGNNDLKKKVRGTRIPS